MTQKELAAKYHWRIKYPNTYEMALRNNFLEGELPPNTPDPEIERQCENTFDFKARHQKRETDKVRTEAVTLVVVAEKKRRRSGRDRHRELTVRGAEPDDLVTLATLEEILDRLDRIESALAAFAE
jgi:hypothetical protein